MPDEFDLVDPRRRTRRLRGRALRSVGRACNIAMVEEAAGRRHVPAPRLHPRQGAPPDRRGPAHRPRGRRVRRQHGDADASTSPPSQTRKQGGRRPADVGPRIVAQGPQGHDRSRHRACSQPDAPDVRVSDGTELRGRNVIIATGSCAAFAAVAGSRLRRRQGVVVRPRPRRSTKCPNACRRDRRRCDRLRVRVVPRRRGRRGHDPRGRCRRSSPASTSRSRKPSRRAFTKRGIEGADRRAGAAASTATARHVRRQERRGAPRSRRRSWSSSGAGRGVRTSGSTRPASRSTSVASSPSTATCARASTACTRSATSSRRRNSRTSRSRRRSSRSRRCSARTRAPIEYDKVPWGIYCHPEVAFCGLTEAQAKDRGYDVVTSVHRWGGNGRVADHGRVRRNR